MADEHTPHVDSAPHVDHEPAPYDDLGIRSIVMVGGIGAVLVFVAVVAVQVVYFRYEHREFQRKVLDVPLTKVDAVLDEQRQTLASAGDSQTGDRRIPIDKAIALIVTEYQANRSEQPAGDEQPAADTPESTGDGPAADELEGDGTPNEGSAGETPASEANSTQP